jgi:hypothetical protein
MKANCAYCGQPVTDNEYRCVNISIAGWPKSLPRTLVAHRRCREQQRATVTVTDVTKENENAV